MNPPSMETQSRSKVPCPECGQEFSPRGLSGHLRLRHGLRPPPALPRQENQAPDATPAILNALVALQDGLERIELHLASVPKEHGATESPEQEAQRIERELTQLLQRIVLVKQTGLASTTIRDPSSEVEKRGSMELARLRRDQARLVFRLEELRSGTPSDERFLI